MNHVKLSRNSFYCSHRVKGGWWYLQTCTLC